MALKHGETFLRRLVPAACLLTLILAVFSAGAEMRPVSGAPPEESIAAQGKALREFDGLIIDSIVIDNRNIFDTDDPEFDHFFFRWANALHIVTRAAVIRREVLLKEGGVFSSQLAAETARNLRSRYSLYNAWIEVDVLPNGHLVMTVVTIDVWSISGGLTLYSEGGETDVELGFKEDNFLGMNQFVRADYVFQESDRNYGTFEFRDPWSFGYPVRLSLAYSGNPFDTRRSIEIERPFYNLSQNWAFSFGVFDRGSRREQFDDDLLVAQSENEGLIVRAADMLRFGAYQSKIGPELEYDYRDERTYNRQIFSGSSVVFPEDSVMHRLRAGLFFENVDFVTARRINGFSFIEDITLGLTAKASVRRAFEPGFDNHIYDQALLEFSSGFRFGHHLFLLNSDNGITYRGTSEIRRVNLVALRYYFNRIRWLTLAANGSFVRDWREDNSARLVLGGKSGLRGYRTEFQTGDRMLRFNFEGRFFPNIELLSVIFGGAAFVDLARTYKPDESFTFKDLEIASGIGLRISFEKSSRSRIVRIDLARDRDGEIGLSVGTGQYF